MLLNSYDQSILQITLESSPAKWIMTTFVAASLSQMDQCLLAAENFQET